MHSKPNTLIFRFSNVGVALPLDSYPRNVQQNDFKKIYRAKTLSIAK
jgi:hypothetical protein